MQVQMRKLAAPQMAVARRPVMIVRAQADKPEQSMGQKMALPLASMVAAAMLAGAFNPEEALAASRSGGRVGGSSGFASRKAPAAAPRGVQTQAAPSVRQTNIIVAPSYSPFGFGGFGFGWGMPMFMPFGGFGFMSSILSFMALLLVANVVVGVVKGFMSNNNKDSKKDDQWGDL